MPKEKSSSKKGERGEKCGLNYGVIILLGLVFSGVMVGAFAIINCCVSKGQETMWLDGEAWVALVVGSLGAVTTAILGYVAVWQNKKAQNISERVYLLENATKYPFLEFDEEKSSIYILSTGLDLTLVFKNNTLIPIEVIKCEAVLETNCNIVIPITKDYFVSGIALPNQYVKCNFLKEKCIQLAEKCKSINNFSITMKIKNLIEEAIFTQTLLFEIHLNNKDKPFFDNVENLYFKENTNE